MNKIKFLSLGSDPEFFVLDPKGKPYPATLFARGTKDSPSPIGPPGGGFFEQRDNLSFEGNVPPAYNKLEFTSSIEFLRNYFASKVEKFGYSISPNGVEYFEKRYRATPEGMEFGCSKVITSWDSNEISIRERPTPILSKAKYRVAGFHIHIGYDYTGMSISKCQTDILVGRLFDLFLTIPSHRIKPEPERIRSYGQYGMIRSKSYGTECRTLSTYFTQREYLPWVWDQVMKIEQFINMCNDKDIHMIIRSGHYTGTTECQINCVFAGIFNNFSDKTVLTNFKETNEIYENETLITSSRYYNSYCRPVSVTTEF